jgi:hypothetical protein
VAISEAVTPNVSFRAFDADTKKWVLPGGVQRMYHARKSPRYSEQLFLRDIQKGERP